MRKLTVLVILFLTSTAHAQSGFPDLNFNPEDPGLGFGRRFNSGPMEFIEQRPDGQTLCFGTFSEYNGATTNNLVLLNGDGTKDESFAVDPDIATALFAVDLFEDKLYVGGEIFPIDGGFQVLARLNDDGTLDDQFQLEGAFEPGSEIEEILALENGAVLVSGEFETYNGETIGNLVLFNSDGTLNDNFDAGTGFSFNGNAATPLDLISDDQGRIIACGFFNEYNGISVEGACRINSDGSLDENFSANFQLEPSNGGGEAVYTAAILDDGKIALGGTFGGTDDFTSGGLIVLNEDGTRDENFDLPDDGFNVGSQNSIRSLAYHPSEVILVGGNFTQVGDSLQTNFTAVNLNGTVNEEFYPKIGTNGRVSDIEVLSSSEVVYVGDFEYVDYRDNRYIMKLNAGGEPDEAFARGASFSNLAEFVQPVPGTTDIYVFGSFSHYKDRHRGFILRLDSEGNPVEEFDTGIGLSGFNSNFSGAVCMEVQEDQKLLLAGLMDTYNGTVEIPNFIRLNADGSLDTSFDIEGSGANTVVGGYNAIKTDSQGRIYVGGGISSWNGEQAGRIVRLNSDGSRDETFSTGNGPNSSVFDMAIDADDRLYVAGDFNFWNGESVPQIVRLNEDGSIDTEFSADALNPLLSEISSIETRDDEILVGGTMVLSDEPGTDYGVLSFNQGGGLTSDFNPYINSFIEKIEVDPSGQIILAEGQGSGSLIRLAPDGTLDADWVSEPGFNMGSWFDITITQDGAVYAVGSFNSFNGVGRQYITKIANNLLVGTQDEAEQEFLSVYPNPSNGQFTLAVEQADLFETLHIYSSDGRLFKKIIIREVPLVLDATEWPQGAYILIVGDKTVKLIR